jgi:uncharacterized protein YndB with AHSA1/START domain
VSTTVSAHGDTQIVMRRAFHAPKAKVFAAITQPELLKGWFGADGWELVVAEVDLRVGGRWRFESIGPGGEKMGQGGVYTLIEPFDRIAYTERYDDQWVAGETLIEVELTQNTTMITTITFPSKEIRDAALRSPMEAGVGQSHDRLEKLL